MSQSPEDPKQLPYKTSLTCISELSDNDTDRPLSTSGVNERFFFKVPTTLAKLLLAPDIDSIT